MINKAEIIDNIKNKISEKINHLDQLISETRASNNDTKSSMGDKYETGREMLQQQINNLQLQRNEVVKQQEFIKTIQIRNNDKVEKGALVKTEKGIYFISVSLGEIKIDNQKIICISPESPLAKMMFGMKIGETFTLNRIQQTVEDVC